MAEDCSILIDWAIAVTGENCEVLAVIESLWKERESELGSKREDLI